MDQKNRLIIAIAVTLLIVAAMFTSFGRSLFSMRTEHIQLPEPGASSSSQEGGGSSQSAELFQRVEVTPQTVQSVIRTLERSTSYYWELTVETFWTGGSSATSVQTWVDGGWSHTRQVLPSGLIRHDLISEDTVYYWYEGSSDYLTAPAEGGSADLAQHIPTYETVLDADPEQITGTGYDDSRGGIPCIYVEVSAPGGERVDRYWISVESGLLISSETLEGEELLYRMTAYSPIQSCPSGTTFQLPGRNGAPQHLRRSSPPLLLLLPVIRQPQQEQQPQGDDQVHVVPLHQQEQDDQDQQDIPAVQLLQPEDFQDAVDPPLVPAEQGVQRALLP